MSALASLPPEPSRLTRRQRIDLMLMLTTSNTALWAASSHKWEIPDKVFEWNADERAGA